jgi:hypothetical protein
MNATEARQVLTDELSRWRLLTHRTLEECTTAPTVEELMADGLFDHDEALLYIAEFDPQVEAADWQKRRDRCTALQMGIRALYFVESLGEVLNVPVPFPDGQFQEVDYADNVRDIVRARRERQV